MTNVPETIRKRVDSLRATLEDHNYYYYVQDDPRIPDAESSFSVKFASR